MTNALVILIGLRASGKTTVGRLLAERLAGAFVDLDDRTAERLHCATTAEALTRYGEPRFREAEADALAHELAGEHPSPPSPTILSLGGGTPMHPDSLARLLAAQQQGHARIIYLRAEAPTLIERLRGPEAAARPSLTGKGTLEEVPVLLAKRDPVYRDLADQVVPIEGLSPAEIADRIQLP